MNILQISSAGSIGGGERHLLDLVSGLVHRGQSVDLAVRPLSPLRSHLSTFPVTRLHLLPLRNAMDLSSALALRRLVRERSIDIVHAHLARDYPLAAFAVRGSANAKLILTRHVLFRLSRFNRLTFGRAAYAIAVSEAVRQGLLAQRIISDERIRVIHNGVDLDRFARPDRIDSLQLAHKQLGVGPDTLLVGSVGSLVPLKGHEDFILAAFVVAKTMPNVHFVIVGDEPPGDEYTFNSLNRLIDQLSLSGRVHLLRLVPDVAPWLRAFDLFVSASHSESFGLAIVEAMAAGCPVVATDTEGAREILADGSNGKLTPIGDVPGLVSSISTLLAGSALRQRMGVAAQRVARERFKVERMVEQTEQLFQEALDHKAG
ncbi:MAG: glycosyltransferase family 4 protein [Pyrinomonadaceae bacterium]